MRRGCGLQAASRSGAAASALSAATDGADPSTLAFHSANALRRGRLSRQGNMLIDLVSMLIDLASMLIDLVSMLIVLASMLIDLASMLIDLASMLPWQ